MKGGADLLHRHAADGGLALDSRGKPIVTQAAQAGYAGQVMDVRDGMLADLLDAEAPMSVLLNQVNKLNS